MDALEKKAAELVREQRFLKLKGIVTEDKLKEREEMRMRKGEVESKIQQVEKLIEKKENELRGLEKEVEELDSELMEGVVRMERGMISKKKRVETENKQKEGEMKKLDLEILIGETKEDMERMEKRREELVSERVIVYEYVKRYEEEEEDRQRDSEVRISQTLLNIFEQYQTFFFFTSNAFFIFFLQQDDDDDDYNDDNDNDDDDANLTPFDDNVTKIYSLDSYDDDDNVELVGIIYSNIFAHSRTFLNINI